MRLIQVEILLLCLSQALTYSYLKKIMVEDEDALCLDGTLAAYYAHEGVHPNKIVLSFEGGGWCGSADGLNQTLQDCLQRSKTEYGTSANYANAWAISEGILSDNPLNQFRDYSFFHLKYCDGTGHQGYRKNPVSYKGSNLYFRGHTILKAQLESINKYYGLWTTATDVVITGQSAGGLAVFLWTNYISQRVPKTAKVWSLPDSGIFLDSANYKTHRNDFRLQFQNFMKFSNQQVSTPVEECDAVYKGQQYKCMFAEYVYAFIKFPQFAIQSPYDVWSMFHILNIDCLYLLTLEKCDEGQLKYLEDYHANMSVVLKAIGQRPGNGYWAPSCINHVFSFLNTLYDEANRIPAYSQFSLMYSISIWMAGTSTDNGHMDDGNWPINTPCSSMQQLSLYQTSFWCKEASQ